MQQSEEITDGVHLLAANVENYFHWMLDGISRFKAEDLLGVGVFATGGRPYRLLVSQLDTEWKGQSLGLMIPPDIEPFEVKYGTALRVKRLVYIPYYAGWGWWGPHRAINATFDRMRLRALWSNGTRRRKRLRKLFISRADSKNRPLTNENEIADIAAGAGFERIVLGDLSVADQVRLFAEATHIIGPHGAGLTNLLFCCPNTAVCELQMDAYVH